MCEHEGGPKDAGGNVGEGRTRLGIVNALLRHPPPQISGMSAWANPAHNEDWLGCAHLVGVWVPKMRSMKREAEGGEGDQPSDRTEGGGGGSTPRFFDHVDGVEGGRPSA